jgi:hypothetical protein
MDNWLILQNFYNGLTPTGCDHIDAAAGDAFFSLTIDRAKTLIEKMVSNQGRNDERLQPRKWSTHTIKETDMLATKLDLLVMILVSGMSLADAKAGLADGLSQPMEKDWR